MPRKGYKQKISEGNKGRPKSEEHRRKRDNLITLCVKCDQKTNHNREYWTNYFQSFYRGTISVLQTVGLNY